MAGPDTGDGALGVAMGCADAVTGAVTVGVVAVGIVGLGGRVIFSRLLLLPFLDFFGELPPFPFPFRFFPLEDPFPFPFPFPFPVIEKYDVRFIIKGILAYSCFLPYLCPRL